MDYFWISLYLLKKFNVNKFLNWMKTYHKINIENRNIKYFQGIHFIVRCLLNNYLDSIWSENIFDFKSNIQTNRIGKGKYTLEDNYFGLKGFDSIKLKDIEIKDELSIVLNKILNLSEKTLKSQNFEDLNNNFNDFINRMNFFYEIFSKYIIVNKNLQLKKEKYLWIILQFYTFAYFNNTERGQPIVSISSVRKEAMLYPPKYRKELFLGYKFGVQYLWYELLGEEFKNSSLESLHQADKSLSNISIGGLEKESIKRRYPKNWSSILKIEKLWKAFDSFFNRINNEIIKSLEKKYKIEYWKDWSLNKNLILCNKSEEFLKKLKLKIFQNLNIKDFTEDLMPYSIKTSEELEKKFNYLPVTILHLDYRKSFEGYGNFIRILWGTVYLRKFYKSNNEIYLKRIKHKIQKGHFYSYAILIDGEGWLLFHCLGTDDPMTTSNDYRRLIEDSLQRANKEIPIIIDEFEIPEELLVFCYKPRYLFKHNLIQQGDAFISYLKGIFFELLLYYFLNRKTKYKQIRLRAKIGNKNDHKEYDLLYKDQFDILHLVECKIDLHESGVEEILKKSKKVQILISKDENLKNLYKLNNDFMFIIDVWVWNPEFREDLKRKLEEDKRIKIISFQKRTKGWNIPIDTKKAYKFILNFKIDYLKNFIDDSYKNYNLQKSMEERN